MSGDVDDPSCCPWDFSEVLLEDTAYISDHERFNHTTAFSLTRDGAPMQATFFLARPPLDSHFSMCCFTNPDEFGSEPIVVATEGNLALIVFTHGSPANCNSRTKHDYHVYRAAGARPSLRRLAHPKPGMFLHDNPYYFHDDQVGLLMLDDSYIVATLCTREDDASQYDLYTYHSDTDAWARKPTALVDRRQQDQLASHCCERVISIGGDDGTIGWVDLGRGIDVLCKGGEEESSPRQLDYIPLPEPEPIQLPDYITSDSQRFRDIAVVKGRIKYVELHIHVRPGSRSSGAGGGSYISDGWMAITRRTDGDGSSGWRKHHELHASDITVDPAAGIGSSAGLLPRRNDDEEEGASLQRLRVGHPTLSLRDDDVVYFMVKVNEDHREAWVIAVDMRKKTLRGVSEFAPRRRTYAMESCYRQTTISKYLLHTAKQ